MKKTRNVLLVAALVVIGCYAGQAPAMTFTPLGDLPGGNFYSGIFYRGVSDDGSVAVGQSVSASGDEAFRWTRGGGMVGLGDLPGGAFNSQAYGVSADGSVVAGASNSASGTEAYRWTSGGGMVGLGDLPGGDFESYGYGVSADGSVVAGLGTSVSGYEAFRWTSGGGMVGLGDLPGEPFFSGAEGISDDGNVVVGAGNVEQPPGTFIFTASEAFRWTSEGGMVGLGDLPGGIFQSSAEGASADGSVVVGIGNGDWGTDGAEAFYWTSDGGMVGLGDLPGGIFSSIAWDVSADGSVVVGHGASASGEEAFRWTSDGGMRNVRELLIAGGVTGLTDWTLNQARAVSADGRAIVGYGTNPRGRTEAWLAVISESGDFDLDGGLTALDIDLLSAEIRNGGANPLFDVNGDSLIDQQDRNQWVRELKGTWMGDADLNGAVAFPDFLALSNSFGQQSGWSQGDFDGSGDVQFADFLLLSENFGKTTSGIATVPEPSSLALCLFGSLGLISTARRRP